VILLRQLGWLAVGFAACATSPVVPEPRTLTGNWAVAEQGSLHGCALKFTLRPVANGHAVEADGPCLRALRLDGVALWRAAPDGIALAGESGRTLAFFSREGPRYVLRRAGCRSLLLTRRATAP
jgi:hypothetical protein